MTIETTNGHVAGRDVPELPRFTFTDSGKTVQFRRLSPLTTQEIDRALRKELPPPEPPMIEVAYGDQKRWEPNKNDPRYHELYAEWELKFQELTGTKSLTLMALRGVVLTLGPDEHAELAALRDDLLAIGIALPHDDALTDEQNDKIAYVLHCLIGSPDEMQQLQKMVMLGGRPTEAQITEQAATFPAAGD